MKNLISITLLIELTVLLSPFNHHYIENITGDFYMTHRSVWAVEKEMTRQLSDAEWNLYYEETIEVIKQHEGFANGKAYSCPAGYRTIGYGHIILPNESFSAQISRTEADRLLRKDFEKALQSAKRISNLEGSRKLAIAHFIFAKGVGRYSRSTLRKLVEARMPIERELPKWSYYRKPSGKKVHSKWSHKNRLWELDMYYRDSNTFSLPKQMMARLI